MTPTITWRSISIRASPISASVTPVALSEPTTPPTGVMSNVPPVSVVDAPSGCASVPEMSVPVASSSMVPRSVEPGPSVAPAPVST
jgi:hypothetical protein